MKGTIRLHLGRFGVFAALLAIFWFVQPEPLSQPEETRGQLVFAVMMGLLVVGSLKWRPSDAAVPAKAPAFLRVLRGLALGGLLGFLGVILWLALETHLR